MSRCIKAKNPCKICLASVTQKNGLQCQGACQSWVHYACLNYTPGKIKDIKTGIIKVTCPCPDCKTTSPKEHRTEEPYSCSNVQCPANQPPKCDNEKCPTNKYTPNKLNQTSFNTEPCTLEKCGTDCKNNSHPQLPEHSPKQPIAPHAPEPPRYPLAKCSSECSEDDGAPGDYAYSSPRKDDSSIDTLEQMCATVGQLSNQINCLMNKMKHVKDMSAGGCFPGTQQGSCSRKGSKSSCPKPCYCPGNPGRRKF